MRGLRSGLAQFAPKIGKPVEVENLFGDVNDLIINVRNHLKYTNKISHDFHLNLRI